MSEFRKLLHHLNKRIGKPICYFSVLNLIYTFSGIIYTFQGYNSTIRVISLNIGNMLLWLAASLFPFFQVFAVRSHSLKDKIMVLFCP